MQPIIQEDKTGGRFACVATLAGVNYQHVKTVAGQLGIHVKDAKPWSDTKYVQTLLTHYGVSTSPRTNPLKIWNKLPPLAFLAIKWHKKTSTPFGIGSYFDEDQKDRSSLTQSRPSRKMSVLILAE